MQLCPITLLYYLDFFFFAVDICIIKDYFCIATKQQLQTYSHVLLVHSAITGW